MKNFKVWIAIAVVVLIALGACGAYQLHKLQIAHSTFENYYAFRGCKELISRTDTEGMCKTGSGETIKILKYMDAWYLDGDLPTCASNFCL